MNIFDKADSQKLNKQNLARIGYGGQTPGQLVPLERPGIGDMNDTISKSSTLKSVD